MAAAEQVPPSVFTTVLHTPITGQIGTEITGITHGMEDTAYHWPLIISGINALYALSIRQHKNLKTSKWKMPGSEAR